MSQNAPWKFSCGDVEIEVKLTDDLQSAHESTVTYKNFKQVVRWNPSIADGAIAIAETALQLAVNDSELVADGAASGIRDNKYRVEMVL